MGGPARLWCVWAVGCGVGGPGLWGATRAVRKVSAATAQAISFGRKACAATAQAFFERATSAVRDRAGVF